ncbi:hypothetical protein ACFE04_020940 [Oxalis oulophora]
MWNRPVHKWMVDHVYFPCLKLGIPKIFTSLLGPKLEKRFSRASLCFKVAEQRRGRIGRTCHGHVYRLVTSSFYNKLEDYECLSILRLSLRQQVLHICFAESRIINDPKAVNMRDVWKSAAVYCLSCLFLLENVSTEWKSHLQDYAQKVGISTPVYETTKGGPSHEPFFMSTVIVNDVRYKSLPQFMNRKAAEQSAAEIALLELTKSGQIHETNTQPLHDTGLCKNLLQEYSENLNYDKFESLGSGEDDNYRISVDADVFSKEILQIKKKTQDEEHAIPGGSENKPTNAVQK